MTTPTVTNGLSVAPGSKYNQDFPALASLYNRPNLGTSVDNGDEKSSTASGSSHPLGRRQEFAIHNEDFPALSSTASNSSPFPSSSFPPLSACSSNSSSSLTSSLSTTGPSSSLLSLLSTGASSSTPVPNSSQPLPQSSQTPSQQPPGGSGSSWWSGGSSWSSSTASSPSSPAQATFSPSWSSSWSSNSAAPPSTQLAGTAQQGSSSWSSWSSLSSLASSTSTSASSSPTSKSRPSSWSNSWTAPNASTTASIPSPLPSPTSQTPPASSPRSASAGSPTSSGSTYPSTAGTGLSYSSLSATNQLEPVAGQSSTEEAGEDNRWGLTGLLSVIRMTHPDLNTLALGTDLTTLGLNLNSTEVLYATFAYPCVDNPCRREPDFVLPYCYYMQPPALKTSHLSKFQLETLFYIFYNMPKDTLQVYAAKELFNRDWRYHKDLGLWFTRDPSAGASGGTYIYFDINSWERRLYRDNNQTLKFMTEEEHGLL